MYSQSCHQQAVIALCATQLVQLEPYTYTASIPYAGMHSCQCAATAFVMRWNALDVCLVVVYDALRGVQGAFSCAVDQPCLRTYAHGVAL